MPKAPNTTSETEVGKPLILIYPKMEKMSIGRAVWLWWKSRRTCREQRQSMPLRPPMARGIIKPAMVQLLREEQKNLMQTGTLFMQQPGRRRIFSRRILPTGSAERGKPLKGMVSQRRRASPSIVIPWGCSMSSTSVCETELSKVRIWPFWTESFRLSKNIRFSAGELTETSTLTARPPIGAFSLNTASGRRFCLRHSLLPPSARMDIPCSGLMSFIW